MNSVDFQKRFETCIIIFFIFSSSPENYDKSICVLKICRYIIGKKLPKKDIYV